MSPAVRANSIPAAAALLLFLHVCYPILGLSSICVVAVRYRHPRTRLLLYVAAPQLSRLYLMSHASRIELLMRLNKDHADKSNGEESLDLFSGFIKFHVLHHAAEQPIYGLWLIEE